MPSQIKMGEENLRVLADAQGGVLPRTLKFRPPFSSLVSPASLHFFVVFSLFLVVNLCLPGHRSGENSESPSYALHAEAKKVLGLARGGTYEPVADFCFSIPEGQKGRIMAQTMVSATGHELVILNKTESEVLAGLRRDIESGAGETPVCHKLINSARVREPLVGGVPMEFRDSTPSLYAMDLAVDSNVNEQHITVWITRCRNNAPVDAMYHLQFTNPGGFWERHFSCEDRGLLPLYLMALVVCALSSLASLSSWRALKRSSSSPVPSLSAGSLCAVILFSLSVLLNTIHLLVYASDGGGIGVLKFLSQFFDACMRCLLFVLIASVATRSSSGGPAIAEQYHTLAVMAAAIYVLCQLVYNVAESQAYTHLSAYFCLRTVWGVPFMLGNAIAAGFVLLVCVNNALFAGDAANRRFQTNFATGCLVYFIVPLVLVLGTNGSSLTDSATMLLLEFVAAHILQRLLCRPPGGAVGSGAKGLPASLQEAHPYTGI
ncbi:rhodopsin-like GPCR transmembrane domain protein [Toxoplasma gondii CAST]|uniref:Rhodopsin-like GPCR transmembrane domain protein n=1 Tax=Toxoplasma gondii CAST TaxID=943122 RepID=A0A425I9Z8_TOXGO|nr:rhodopsin-like GPCR transmembrane domain protein [Toxoplasma gondii CAST]